MHRQVTQVPFKKSSVWPDGKSNQTYPALVARALLNQPNHSRFRLDTRVAEPFSKWGGTSARWKEIIANFMVWIGNCDVQWRTQKIFMGGVQSAKIFLCTKIKSMIRKNIKQAPIQYVNVVKQQKPPWAFQPAVWGISCPVLLPSHCNDSACTYHSAIFVKPQQWPTPSESIAIYCVRKLVSWITHLQSCAKVDIWNKKKKLRTVAKVKT